MTIKNIINNNNKIHPHVPDMGGIETMLRGYYWMITLVSSNS